MSSLKGTAYPKLVDSITKVVGTHAQIAGDIAEHARNSKEKRDAARTHLGMLHAAKAVLEKEGES